MGVLIRGPGFVRGLVGFVGLGLAMSACDPVVDGRYRGEPVFSFEGELVQFDGLADQEHTFRTTLMWLTDLSTDPATQAPRLDRAVEQRSAAVELRFPSSFRLDLFAPPEPSMLVPGTGLGVALVVVFEDRDGDGRLTLDARPSELVGGAPYEAIVYARDEAAAREAPFDEPVEVGFQLVRLPLTCGLDALESCPTPLGASCGEDADCGEVGVCLESADGVSWPGGACVLREETVTCLPPADAGAYVTIDGTLYFIVGCDDAEDCRSGYRCDDVGLGCVPMADADRERFEARRAFTPASPRGATCDILIGSPCVRDADCGPGTCLVRSNGESFRGGYCTLTIELAEQLDCEPAGAVPVAWDFRLDGRETHWFAACDGDADCRADAGYTCDLWLEACLPTSPVALELGPDYTPSAVCYGTPSVR